MAEYRKYEFRLALRVRGDWWVAYLAKPGTMDDAYEIGRILLNVVNKSVTHKQLFVNLMSGVIADSVEHLSGVRPDTSFEPVPCAGGRPGLMSEIVRNCQK